MNERIEAHEVTMEGLWDARDAARFLKCSTSYIYKAAERDRLPSVRVGRMLRFNPDAVRAFARGQ
jgi:excisionase family DNA binding protein